MSVNAQPGDRVRVRDDAGWIYAGRVWKISRDKRDAFVLIDEIEREGAGSKPTYSNKINKKKAKKIAKRFGWDWKRYKGRRNGWPFPDNEERCAWVSEILGTCGMYRPRKKELKKHKKKLKRLRKQLTKLERGR